MRAASKVIGLDLTDDELSLLLGGVTQDRAGYEVLRRTALDNALAPAVTFSPYVAGVARRVTVAVGEAHPVPDAKRPDDLGSLAFADLDTLSTLVRTRQVSCVELAELSLARLARLDPTLHCVITLTRDRALAQAKALDAELAAGHWRGPLHGIPWGAKDLLATKGVRTTWGCKAYEDQLLDVDAAVVQRLDEAGAVLVAKLSLGALAWGDEWFGGTTRNPWNPEQGSSGSSAGPASAVAAGCVPFAIGSETLGSIVSPSARCGDSSLRPTFGRVSRRGAMALSWTMDKLGPMCRSARDCALVFAAIAGEDPLDETTRGPRFVAPPRVDPKTYRVGIDEAAFRGFDAETKVIEDLAQMGVQLVPVAMPDFPLEALLVVLSAEAAEAFDELTLDGRDDLLVRQVEQAWPNVFRQARFVPAVEYLRAQRVRRQLMLAMDALFADVDLFVSPANGGASLAITNLTGHPCVVMPCGLREDGTPRSIVFTGRLDDEARLLAFADAWQRATGYHLVHPEL
ncbi:MAG: amidase [Planctomycetes bacterium]|nr:amidase [Planctomycetota bacterium]